MRRTLIPLAAFLAGLALAAPANAQSTLKIGYIDSQQIVQEAPGAQQARQTLQQEITQLETQAQQLSQEFQDAVAQYEQQQLTLSDQARQAREQELMQQQQEMQSRIAQLEQQAAQREQELIAPIMQQINTVIEEIRREGNYTMIFDAAAQGLIAADPGFDLTPEVIRRLREQAPATGAPVDSTSTGSSNR